MVNIQQYAKDLLASLPPLEPLNNVQNDYWHDAQTQFEEILAGLEDDILTSQEDPDEYHTQGTWIILWDEMVCNDTITIPRFKIVQGRKSTTGKESPYYQLGALQSEYPTYSRKNFRMYRIAKEEEIHDV